MLSCGLWAKIGWGHMLNGVVTCNEIDLLEMEEEFGCKCQLSGEVTEFITSPRRALPSSFHCTGRMGQQSL